jgi:hypothetical protein
MASKIRNPGRPRAGNGPTRLLKASHYGLKLPTKGEAFLLHAREAARKETAEYIDGVAEPSYSEPEPEDVFEKLNRHQRRVIGAEARSAEKKRTKRQAEKKRKQAKKLVEMV